jgi:hypothetical protein
MLTNNVAIFTNADMSGDLHSTPYFLDQDYGYGIQLVWTGSVTGTFTVEISNDVGVSNPDGTVSGVTNFTTLSNSSQAITNAGNLFYNVNLAFYRWVRIAYAHGSGGTASLNGRIQAKGV